MESFLLTVVACL